MSNTTITIEQAIQAAQAEIEAMTFRVGDANYAHAQAAHELIRAIRGWYAQAQAKAAEQVAPDQESMEQTERECEA